MTGSRRIPLRKACCTTTPPNPITLVYHPVLLVTVLPTMEDDLKLFHMLQLEITPRLYEEIPWFHTTAKLVHIKLRDARIKIKIHPLTYYWSGCKRTIILSAKAFEPSVDEEKYYLLEYESYCLKESYMDVHMVFRSPWRNSTVGTSSSCIGLPD
jgi:hypothetical protein